MLRKLQNYLGRALARYLTQPVRTYELFAVSDVTILRKVLQPADIILIEGNTRISTAIKYLTQSTWSHACMYIGEAQGPNRSDLVEADLIQGVIAVPLEKYAGFNLRICRPFGLTGADQSRVVESIVSQLGKRYDLKNVIDLMRYLLPTPPVPVRFRRRLMAFGSGDPTRGICSTMIAQAFQAVRYPILPRSASGCTEIGHEISESDCLDTRHYSHFTPRDFDLSPYFAVVKPTLEMQFKYKQLHWVADV
ncbi:MAG TPA: YiiX/YebB-like N1pC/P60 family cysteine hydrolase [Gammaproteobacteria bacterium]|nr:YiiX/YebB-like N1pC/P60 family cysteine hydrolase [Gammaproteobacteria bacterium]